VNSTPGRFSNSIHTDSSHFDEFREFRRFCNPAPIRLNRSRVMGTSHAPCVSHAHTPDQESFGPSTPPLPGWQPEKEPPRLLKNETRDEEREGRDRSRKLLPSAARMLPLFPTIYVVLSPHPTAPPSGFPLRRSALPSVDAEQDQNNGCRCCDQDGNHQTPVRSRVRAPCIAESLPQVLEHREREKRDGIAES
jgi:hypothetical protein